MKKFKEQLGKCQQEVNKVCGMINIQKISCNNISCNELYDSLYQLIPLIPDECLFYRNRLHDVILPNLKMKDLISINEYGRRLLIPQNGINPYVFGETIATIAYLDEYSKNKISISIWDNIHPQIITIAKKRFEDGHYADSVEAAFKEINFRVKQIYKKRTLEEKDGNKLMTAAFSVQNPIIKIADISTENGRNIQQGYMELFAGSMIGIRNPKAHSNQSISKSDAVRKLHFASMLMYKIDNEIV